MAGDLTPDEQERLAAMVKELINHGYQEITGHGRLKVGTRIRHQGHQWTEAFRDGTGIVAALTERPDSPWSMSWNMPDIELIALWDKPQGLIPSRLSGVAQYHVDVIEVDQ